jgi:hypothetical protein
MIKISIEVESGATSFEVAVQAESIEGALGLVKSFEARMLGEDALCESHW